MNTLHHKNKICSAFFIVRRPRFFIAIILCLMVIFSVGCGGTSSSKKLSDGPAPIGDDLDAGRIQGTVTSLDTGTVIKGAVVETFSIRQLPVKMGVLFSARWLPATIRSFRAPPVTARLLKRV